MGGRNRISAHERARRRGRLRIKDVADHVGCHHSYVSRIESGRVAASVAYQTKFCCLAGAEVDWIFDDDGYTK